MYGLFFPASKKASIYVVDTVRTNQMPNMTNLFSAEHATKWVWFFSVLHAACFTHKEFLHLFDKLLWQWSTQSSVKYMLNFGNLGCVCLYLLSATAVDPFIPLIAQFLLGVLSDCCSMHCFSVAHNNLICCRSVSLHFVFYYVSMLSHLWMFCSTKSQGSSE